MLSRIALNERPLDNTASHFTFGVGMSITPTPFEHSLEVFDSVDATECRWVMRRQASLGTCHAVAGLKVARSFSHVNALHQ